MSETKEELKPYWNKDFKVDETTHNIKLYHYSAKSIAMVSDEVFGKRFAKYFKEINGRFNPRLSVGSGWIFKLDSQKDLTSVLQKIFRGEAKPTEISVTAPLFEDKDIDNKIFNTLADLIELIPTEKDERVVSEKDGVRTTVYYNKDDDTITHGDCIYSFTSAHKSLDIHQLTF
tara:strand:- start:2884 stop:3405 length:522 start_codon:yes stop_codon:yes gene_type:complete